MSPRRIGLIGLGAISRYYLSAIDAAPGWDLAALCDVRAPALRPHHGHVPCYTDHRRMLAECDLDAVVVAVPNHAHATVCAAALRAGVAVCVEKPLALTVAEGRALGTLAAETDTPLFTAFHRRYNDAVARLRGQLSAGGGIASVRVRYLERIEEHIQGDTWYLDPERCGGGCVADNGPNAFDLVRLLLGEVTVERATVARDVHGVDRQAVVDLSGAGGRTARVELDWSWPGETKDLQVRRADGTVLHADMLALHPGFKASLWHEYAGILDDFAHAVHTGTRADGGLAALELVSDTYDCEEPPARAAEEEQAR